MGLAALVAGLLLLRNGHELTGIACLVLALLFVLSAVTRPAMLDPIARRWLALAEVMARVVTPLLLALVYFLIVTPMGLLRRTLGKSPFVRDPRADSYWIPSMPRDAAARRARMQRQF
jgi:hypothetical protein